MTRTEALEKIKTLIKECQLTDEYMKYESPYIVLQFYEKRLVEFTLKENLDHAQYYYDLWQEEARNHKRKKLSVEKFGF